MSPCKELLLSCIVMMHISFMTLRPTEQSYGQEKLTYLMIPLIHLQSAEGDYIKHMFGGIQPNKSQLKTLEGITWPAGNTTKEIQTSICAIIDYLDNHMPTIISSLTQENRTDLVTQIRLFNTQFKKVVHRGQYIPEDPKSCHRNNLTTSHDYEKKQLGFRIIYFSRQWVEHFANSSNA